MTRRALVLALAALAPVAAQAGEVWTALATEKIRPNAKARPSTEARISAARNEFEAFQIVVTGPATKVSARASALSGPGTIDGVRLYRVDTIDVKRPSALDGATGRWPDALVPDVDEVAKEKRNAFPFDVRAGESRAIWVEVHVPRGARGGDYHGTVTVSSGEGEAEIPVSLAVFDFELPSTATLRSAFGLAYGTVTAAHRTSGDETSALRARYGALGLDHRISLTTIADDGRHANLGNFDRFYGPLVAGTAATTLPGARMSAVQFVGNRGSSAEQRAWAQHFRSKGWFDRLFAYVCDEPPLTCRWSDVAPRAKASKDADPELKTLVTTQLWDAEEHGVADDIDIMVPVVNFMDDKAGSAVAGSQRHRYDPWLRSSPRKELWLYQSCMSHGCGGTVNMGSPSESDRYFTGWPSYMIDASAVRNRAMEWLSFANRATGEVYWETTMAYTHDAWSNQWDFSGNGDGTLFYPGTPGRIGGRTHVPVASIRLKMIREGMEDYEYLAALAKAGDPDLAMRIATELFPNPYSTEVAPEKLMEARERIALRILALTGKQAPAGASAGGAGGGGCGTAGGGGLAALLALPGLLALRRRARRA